MRGKEIPFLVVFLLLAVVGFVGVRAATGVDRTPVPEIPLASVTPATGSPSPTPTPARPTGQRSDTPVVDGGGVPVDRDDDQGRVDRPRSGGQASGGEDEDDDADDGGRRLGGSGDDGDDAGDENDADADDDSDGDDDSGDDDDEDDDDGDD